MQSAQARHLLPVDFHDSVAPSNVDWHRACAACSDDAETTGYIRLVVFSQNAAADVQHAIQTLQRQVR